MDSNSPDFLKTIASITEIGAMDLDVSGDQNSPAVMRSVLTEISHRRAKLIRIQTKIEGALAALKTRLSLKRLGRKTKLHNSLATDRSVTRARSKEERVARANALLNVEDMEIADIEGRIIAAQTLLTCAKVAFDNLKQAKEVVSRQIQAIELEIRLGGD